MKWHEAAAKAYIGGRESCAWAWFAGLRSLPRKVISAWRRAPVFLQVTATECGAACLAMVLNYYGHKARVATCREYLGSGEDGVTAQSIAKAARHHGLLVKAYSLEPAEFKHIRLPAIVHWNFNHFIVVEHWSAKRIEIIDPAVGRRKISPDEFDAGFTGVVLTFEPGVQFKRRQSAARPGRFSYLKSMLCIPGTPGFLVQILGASLLLQVLGLALPLFTKVIVDQVLPFRISNVLTILGAGMVVLVLAQMVTSYLRAKLLIHLQARSDWHMMLGFFGHLLALPYRFFQQRSSGDLLMRLASNTIIREALTSQTTGAVLDGSLVLVYLAILIALEPMFGLIVIGLGLLQVGLLLVSTRPMHQLMQQDLAAQAESQSYLVEALTGIATLKASGAEDRTLDRWSNLFVKELNISLRRNHLSAIIDTGITTLRTFSPLVLLWVGAIYVLNGTMSLGTMLAINALAVSFLTPLASLVAAGQQLQLVGAHLDRLTDVLEAEPEQDFQAIKENPLRTRRIELEGVGFQYSPDSPPVLKDISVTIEPGQKVALVGLTASGKSTLAKLLLGLYTPTEGEIRYDGIPLQNLDYRARAASLG